MCLFNISIHNYYWAKSVLLLRTIHHHAKIYSGWLLTLVRGVRTYPVSHLLGYNLPYKLICHGYQPLVTPFTAIAEYLRGSSCPGSATQATWGQLPLVRALSTRNPRETSMPSIHSLYSIPYGLNSSWIRMDFLRVLNSFDKEFSQNSNWQKLNGKQIMMENYSCLLNLFELFEWQTLIANQVVELSRCMAHNLALGFDGGTYTTLHMVGT